MGCHFLLSAESMASRELLLHHRTECEDESAFALARNGHFDDTKAWWKRSTDTGYDHSSGFGTDAVGAPATRIEYIDLL